MENKLKKITILSGKGGTGKTSVSSNLALLLSKEKKMVVADCDADAPNLALAFGINEEDFDFLEEVQTNEKAVMDKNMCDGCKKCYSVCNFGAIKWDKKNKRPIFNSLLCEGCGACQFICPKRAIELVKIKNGKVGYTKTKHNFYLVSGSLKVSSTGSGKIVSLIKKKSEELARKENAQVILTDSAAGIGCPVIASIQGSDFIIAVTEPTPSALSDLKRALRTANHFQIPYGIIINKYNINKKFSKRIELFMEKNKIPLMGKISYSKDFVEALVNMKPVIEIYPKYEKIFNKILIKMNKEIEKRR